MHHIKIVAARLALLVCMADQMPNAHCHCPTKIFSSASCTRFSPQSVTPAAKAIATLRGECVLTAISVTSSGERLPVRGCGGHSALLRDAA